MEKIDVCKEFVACAISTCESLEQLESAKKIIPFFQALFGLSDSDPLVMELTDSHELRLQFLQFRDDPKSAFSSCPGCKASFEAIRPGEKGDVPKICLCVCKGCALPLKMVALNQFQKIPSAELDQLQKDNPDVYNWLMTESFLVHKKNALRLPTLN